MYVYKSTAESEVQMRHSEQFRWRHRATHVAEGGKAPVSPCKPLCARFRAGVACVPDFAHESERGAFVPEVLKTVWTMCWKRWYDCVSCAFHGFFEDEKESRIKGWRRNRRSAQSLLPAVRAVDGGFSAVGCGVF